MKKPPVIPPITVSLHGLRPIEALSVVSTSGGLDAETLRRYKDFSVSDILRHAERLRTQALSMGAGNRTKYQRAWIALFRLREAGQSWPECADALHDRFRTLFPERPKPESLSRVYRRLHKRS